MSRLTSGLVFTAALWMLPLALPAHADQRRAAGRRPPQTAVRIAPRPGAHVVFIGGYFYDPFFGPYPWWRHGAPVWYVPIYDTRAELRIEASPRRAAVYVDGYYAGLVDDFDGVFQRLPVTPGGHELTLYLEGFVTMRWRLYLQPGSTATLRHVMVPAPPGAASEPPRLAPPIPPPPLGTYAPPRTAAPVVGRASPTAPVTGFGTLALHVQPANAGVEIDGEHCLTSAPGYVEAHVAAGEHRVSVTMPGYQSFATVVQVTEGDTTTLNVLLPVIAPPTP
jgi:hypothetical protein